MIKKAPFKVEEEGWGEFDLGVTLHLAEREGVKELKHDLNFQESRYESPHKLVSALRDLVNDSHSRIVLRHFYGSLQSQDQCLDMMTRNVRPKVMTRLHGRRPAQDGQENLPIWND